MANGTALIEDAPQVQEPRPRTTRPPGVPIHLHGVSWSDYVELCDLIGEVHVRTSFINGEVEIMTLSYEHEFWTTWLNMLIEVLTEELDIPRASAGMTTFRREDLERLVQSERERQRQEPYLIQPSERPVKRREGSSWGPCGLFPAIACVGRFDSFNAARDKDLAASCLTVIWFQHEFAFPIDPGVREQIRAIDWEKHAHDFDW